MIGSDLTANDIDEFYSILGERRLFTIQSIRFAYEEYFKKLEALEEDAMPRFRLMGFDGEVHEVESEWQQFIPGGYTKYLYQILKFLTYQEMAGEPNLHKQMFRDKSGQPTPEWDYYVTGLMKKIKSPYYVVLFGLPTFQRLSPTELEQAEGSWAEDEIRRLILSAFQSHARDSVRVEKIVCVGLGPLVAERNVYHNLVPLDIAEQLSKLYAQHDEEQQKPIPLFYQDPSYGEVDEEHLHALAKKRNLSIEFKKNPTIFEEFGPRTLILAHGSVGFPIRQITADLGVEYGGPAGIFCWVIDEAGDSSSTSEDEVDWYRYHAMNPQNRYVTRMLEEFNMREVCHIEDWWNSLYLKKAN